MKDKIYNKVKNTLRVGKDGEYKELPVEVVNRLIQSFEECDDLRGFPSPNYSKTRARLLAEALNEFVDHLK